MSEMEANTPTILDYLNNDCLRLVLRYVSVKDIIQLERVSRQWQRVVLEYLQSIPIGIQDIHKRYSFAPCKVYWLRLDNANLSSFSNWTSKMGASVVAAHCDSEMSFEILRENCPNLKVVTVLDKFEHLCAHSFSWLSEEQLMNDKNENFKRLLRVCFNNLKISEHHVSQFIASDALEELAFWFCENITGECLANLNSNLKYFGFDDLNHSLDIGHLLAAADRLRELTSLELNDVDEKTCKNIYLLLDRLPKLEHLLLDTANDVVMSDDFFKSVCGLSRLKGLVTTIAPTHERLLEAVARCCRELRTLDLRYSDYVTGRGLAAVCARAGARLESLGVHDNDNISDDDAVACVRACPKLESLTLRCCPLLSAAVLARAAAARRELRAQGARGVLQLDLTYCEGVDEEMWDDCKRYEADGLILYSDCEPEELA